MRKALFAALYLFSTLGAEECLFGGYSGFDECQELQGCNGVYLACIPYSFELEAKALYLQPSFGNLSFGVESGSDRHIHDIKPSYHFGFEVGGSLFFQSRNSALRLNYCHLNGSDSSHSRELSPVFDVDGDLYTIAKGTTRYDFNGLNLDYGIVVQFGDYLKTEFYTGLYGVRIEQHFTRSYFEEELLSLKIKRPVSFLGAGPEAGIAFSYDLFGGVLLTGNAKAALLIGNLKNRTTYDSEVNRETLSSRDRTAVIPAFEGVLGIGYNFNSCSYQVEAEAGYLAKLFLDVVESNDFTIFAESLERNSSNFSLAGPYLKVAVRF